MRGRERGEGGGVGGGISSPSIVGMEGGKARQGRRVRVRGGGNEGEGRKNGGWLMRG